MDFQRATKQTVEVPLYYTATLWMLKNLRAILSLYFGPKSLTIICLSSWVTHFEHIGSIIEAYKMLTPVL